MTDESRNGTKSTAQTRTATTSVEGILNQAHMEEIARKGAESWNWGWFSSPHFIESKTDKGVLSSRIDAKGRIAHRWTPFKQCRGAEASPKRFGSRTGRK
jgi:hypothetical protein